MSNSEIIVTQLQMLPWFREPTTAEIEGACLHADPKYNMLDFAGRKMRRDEALNWLRAWKAQANAKWLEAEPLPEYKRRKRK